MKVVIDIPDHIYKTVVGTGKFFPYRFNTARAIKNGKAVPKSLIDADKAQEVINNLLKEPDYQHEGEDWRTGLIMAEELMCDAQTTIEEDMENIDEDND